MSIKKLIPIIGSLAALVGYSYYESQQKVKQPKKPIYHYQIHKENFQVAPDGSAVISIKHSHQHDWDSQAQQNSNLTLPFVYQIQLKTGHKFLDEIEVANNNQINSIVDNRKPQQIKFAILKSQEPLNISSKVRILQGITTDDPFIHFGLVFFSKIFGTLRNLIFIGIITNTFDILFPLIIFNQCFSMIGLWTKQKHLLEPFFLQIHNSNYDLFNLIRKSITPLPDIEAIEVLQTYGYSSEIFFNVSGEFIVTIALLIFTIIIKALHIFAKIEKVRFISSKLRPIWNGYVFCIMPRIAVFIGFQTRNVFEARFIDILNVVIAALLLAGLIYFFAQLIIFVRKINERVQYLQETYLEIGLSRKLEFEKEFDFDCLHYSILHYPAMNYLRLLFFFIPIGASHDLHYISIGFPIASQVFFIMINISCSGYRKTRDKVLYVFADLFFILIGLCLLTIGLAQSVNHSQVSIIAQIVLFSFVLVNFIILVLTLLMDIYSYFIEASCINSKKGKGKGETALRKKNGNTNSRRRFVKPAQTKRKRSAKSQQKQSESEPSQHDQSSDKKSDVVSEQSVSQANTKQKSVKTISDDDSQDTVKKNYILPQTQVKKVKKGKVI